MKKIDLFVQRLETHLKHEQRPNISFLTHLFTEIAQEDIGVFFAKLPKLPHSLLGEILLEFSDALFCTVIERLPLKLLCEALHALPSDVSTDFMQRLQKNNPRIAGKVFLGLDVKKQQTVHTLSQYNEAQVGAYMETELIAVSLNETKYQIVEKVREFRKTHPDNPIIKAFVIDEQQKLVATLHFTDLILFNDLDTVHSILAELKPHQPLSIKPDADLEDLLLLFEDYDLSSLAVIDYQGRLMGRVMFDDIYDVIRQRETEQIFQQAGANLEAETESISAARKARLNWIFINLGAILLAAFVVKMFEDTIHQVVALAVLMPVVAALGGNAGNQAVTVTVRRMALKDIEMAEGWQILKREFWIGSLNGVIVGMAVALIAWVWFESFGLAWVIALATSVNLMLAGFLGAFIPLAIKRFGGDPAIASPLLLTTATDAIGFFVFLGLATLFLLGV